MAGLNSASSALFGQPQAQFILAGQALANQALQASTAPPQAAAAGAASAATIPVQQILIPVSTANGSQQLLSIPLSLATGAGNQIQLLTTSNGQLIATNLASLAQPMNVAVSNAGTAAPTA